MFDSAVDEKSSLSAEELWEIAVTYLTSASQNRVATLLEADDCELATIAILGGIDRRFSMNAISFKTWQECQAKLGLSVEEVNMLRSSTGLRLAA